MAAFLPGIFSAGGMPKWWCAAIAIPLLSSLKRVPIPALALLGWALFLQIYKGHPVEGGFDLLMLLIFIGAIAVGAELGADGILRGALWGLLPSMLLVPLQLMDMSPVVQGAAPAGLFFNSEVLAEVSAILLAWALVERRWLWAIVPAVPVLLCHSRIAPMLVVAALLFAWAPKRWPMRLAVAASFGCAALAAIVVFGPAKFDTAGLRMVLWGAATMSITPLGHGLGWWRAAHPFPIEEVVHSDVLQIFVELGIVGGALLIWLGARTWFAKKGPTSLAQRATFIVFSGECLVSFPMHTPAAAFIGGVLAGSLAYGRADVRSARLPGRTALGQYFRAPNVAASGLAGG